MNCCDYSTIDMGLYNPDELVVKLTSVLEAHDEDNTEVQKWAQEAEALHDELNKLELGTYDEATGERHNHVRMLLDGVWMLATEHPNVQLYDDSQVIAVHDTSCDRAERDYDTWHETDLGLGGEIPGHYAKWADEGHHSWLGGVFHWECLEPGCKQISLDNPHEDYYEYDDYDD